MALGRQLMIFGMIMNRNTLLSYINDQSGTLLGVGPISKNCVDAVLELSDEHDIPLILIASRNQIDSEEFGGGYVNNWTTESFADYVNKNSGSGKVILARDHGGPWQNKTEVGKKLSLSAAMDSAKKSYKADIDAGFKILHIDPSIDIHKHPSQDEILERVFELYEYCLNYASEQAKELIFEIGTEEQSGFLNSNEDLKKVLDKVHSFCDELKYPKPSFVVIQTGTKVKEMKNIGRFEKMMVQKNGENELKKSISEIVAICNQAGIFMKTHNMDYLSHEALNMHTDLGIHAANVAPEFGVTETKTLLSLLSSHSMQSLANQFLELSYQSKKWEKWMQNKSEATDRDRSVIAGHYVFSTKECLQIKQEAADKLSKKGIDLESTLKGEIKKQITRYLKGYRIIH
ncbi:MAG: class II D-tagatose-bisphosphate aldolase, non-catalytic subunit [Balneolaceae bacterium]|nr:class II D-tagatose-bisphosphate aldolase, non-catalytic subunit [Balneolaceae bacterium]